MTCPQCHTPITLSGCSSCGFGMALMTDTNCPTCAHQMIPSSGGKWQCRYCGFVSSCCE